MTSQRVVYMNWMLDIRTAAESDIQQPQRICPFLEKQRGFNVQLCGQQKLPDQSQREPESNMAEHIQ